MVAKINRTSTNICVLLFLFTIFIAEINSPNMASKKLISVDFQVYGRVQGVFFRKHTEKQSKLLGLKGWCMNTEKGTVQGTIQGVDTAVNDMKHWLRSTGSPSSKIDKCEFSNEKEIRAFSYSDFKIRH